MLRSRNLSQQLAEMASNSNHSNINDVLKQILSIEMINEAEATFTTLADAQGIMQYHRIPLALKALGMSLEDFGGEMENYSEEEVDIDKFLSIVVECLKCPAWAANEMEEAFRLFDNDGNGYIDPTEFQRILGRLNENLLESEVKEQLKEYDLDGDMELVLTEYHRMIASTKASDFIFEDSQYGVN